MFFFSSRRRHTRYWRDWSSDVCSSDLAARLELGARECRGQLAGEIHPAAQRRLGLRLVVQRVARVQIGRASCRERVTISEVDVTTKKENINTVTNLRICPWSAEAVQAD